MLPKIAAPQSADSFLLLIDGLVQTGILTPSDGAWLRGRRAAGDEELCDAVAQFEVDGEQELAERRLLEANEASQKHTSQSRRKPAFFKYENCENLDF